jgi:hypothetical protein
VSLAAFFFRAPLQCRKDVEIVDDLRKWFAKFLKKIKKAMKSKL